jgi:hypothetical protein
MLQISLTDSPGIQFTVLSREEATHFRVKSKFEIEIITLS